MAPRARRPKPPTARGPAQSIRAPRFYAYPLPHSHTPGASSRLASIAYNCLFVVLVLFIVTALLAALFDIARQLIESSRASRVSDVAITFGTYVVIGLVGISIVISRKLSVKGNVASIPKGYIPVAPEDIPTPANMLLKDEYDRVSLIVNLATPKGRTQAGYGKPGGPYEGAHLRTGILSTINILRNTISDNPSLTPHIPRASSLSPLTPLLALSPSPSPALQTMAPLAELYEQYLVKAMYDMEEPSEEDSDMVLKIVALFLDVLVDLRTRKGSIR